MLNFSGNPFNVTALRQPSNCGASGSSVAVSTPANNIAPYYYNNSVSQSYSSPSYNYSYATPTNYNAVNQNVMTYSAPQYYCPHHNQYHQAYGPNQYSYPQTYWPIQTPTTIQPTPVFQQPPNYYNNTNTCRQQNNYCDFSMTNSYLPGTVTHIDGGTTYFDLGSTWHGFGDFNWYRN